MSGWLLKHGEECCFRIAIFELSIFYNIDINVFLVAHPLDFVNTLFLVFYKNHITYQFDHLTHSVKAYLIGRYLIFDRNFLWHCCFYRTYLAGITCQSTVE